MLVSSRLWFSTEHIPGEANHRRSKKHTLILRCKMRTHTYPSSRWIKNSSSSSPKSSRSFSSSGHWSTSKIVAARKISEPTKRHKAVHRQSSKLTFEPVLQWTNKFVNKLMIYLHLETAAIKSRRKAEFLWELRLKQEKVSFAKSYAFYLQTVQKTTFLEKLSIFWTWSVTHLFDVQNSFLEAAMNFSEINLKQHSLAYETKCVQYTNLCLLELPAELVQQQTRIVEST